MHSTASLAVTFTPHEKFRGAMRKHVVVAVFFILLGGALVPGAVLADPPFKAKPFTFVGETADCAGSKIVEAAWQTHEGFPDAGKSNHGLFVAKLGLTSDCSSAGAVIDGVSGITLTEIGFDIRADGHCGAGAPRFNVSASDGFHFLGGCANATNTPAAGWTRVRIDPANPAQAFPPIAAGATIFSIAVLFDEGTDVGVGFAVIDNIDINGVLIGKPGNAK
jgi:hypothetical protein